MEKEKNQFRSQYLHIISFFRRSKKTSRTKPHQSEYNFNELYHQEQYFYPLGDKRTSSQIPASPNLLESEKRARASSISPPENEKIIHEEKDFNGKVLILQVWSLL